MYVQKCVRANDQLIIEVSLSAYTYECCSIPFTFPFFKKKNQSNLASGDYKLPPQTSLGLQDAQALLASLTELGVPITRSCSDCQLCGTKVPSYRAYQLCRTKTSFCGAYKLCRTMVPSHGVYKMCSTKVSHAAQEQRDFSTNLQ